MLVGDLAAQSITAQQIAITNARQYLDDVGFHVGLNSQCTGEHAALTMGARPFHTQMAFSDHLGHHAVILGELFEFATTQQIRARITHVGNGQSRFTIVLDHRQRSEGGSHSL